MKKIFLLLSIFSLFFLSSCEKKSEVSQKIFSSENFLASLTNTGTIETNTGIIIPYSYLKNKWVRDCIEQDFKCVGADEDCKFSLGQGVGGCNFGCGEGNDEVILRKNLDGDSVICNSKTGSGLIAKQNATKNCLTETYTGASLNHTFCKSGTSPLSQDGKDLICICGTGNKWNMNGNNVSITYDSPFCETEGEKRIVHTSIGGKDAYYLAECEKSNDGFSRFKEVSGNEGKLGFYDIDGEICSGDNIGLLKYFFKPASELGKCNYKKFTCNELIFGGTGVWLESAEINNQGFYSKNCVLDEDSSNYIETFSICEKNNINNCVSSNGGVLNIASNENTKLSFDIIGKNYEGVQNNKWAYKVKILDNFYILNSKTLPFIGSNDIGELSLLGKGYSIEITPASNITKFKDTGDEITEYVWDESKKIIVTVKDVNFNYVNQSQNTTPAPNPIQISNPSSE